MRRESEPKGRLMAYRLPFRPPWSHCPVEGLFFGMPAALLNFLRRGRSFPELSYQTATNSNACRTRKGRCERARAFVGLRGQAA